MTVFQVLKNSDIDPREKKQDKQIVMVIESHSTGSTSINPVINPHNLMYSTVK